MNTNTYIENLVKLASYFPSEQVITNKIKIIKEFDRSLKNSQLPKINISTLVFSEDEITKILKNNLKTLNVAMKKLEQLDLQLSYFRQYLQEKYGYWATITTPFMKEFVKQFPSKKVLELMAGNGYISSFYRQYNLSAYATDSQSWSKTSETGRNTLTDIEILDSLQAFDKYQQKVDIIILAWSPDFDEVDYQLLLKYRSIAGDKPLFFIIGEKNGATNSSKFWNNVKFVNNIKIDKVNEVYSNYDIVQDKLYLIE